MKLTQLNEKMPAWFAAEATMAGCVAAVQKHRLRPVVAVVTSCVVMPTLLRTHANAAFVETASSIPAEVFIPHKHGVKRVSRGFCSQVGL